MVCQHDNFFIREAPLRDVVMTMLEEPRGLGIGATCIHFLSTATLNYRDKVKRRYNLDLEPVTVRGLKYPLVPLAFWYGRSHVTYSDYVRSYVLHRPLGLGSHLEELLGEKQLHDIVDRGPQAHKEYGTYVLDQGVEILYHLSGRRARQATKEDQDIYSKQKSFLPSKLQTSPKKSETAPIDGSFTTARSCQAIVPGLVFSKEPSGEREKTPSKKKFTQRCFHCGEKGHSKNFCPERCLLDERQTVEIIDLS
jgi:hypothetical protein